MAKSKKNETLFSETDIGMDVQLFHSRWIETLYAKKFPNIDTEKLWWSVINWSDGKGEKRVDWLAVARTFHMRTPNAYVLDVSNTRGDAKIFSIQKNMENILNAVSGTNDC